MKYFKILVCLLLLTYHLAYAQTKSLSPTWRNGGVICAVNSINFSGGLFFFALSLSNRSNVEYNIDFVRFYVRDSKKLARTAIQEQRLHPLPLSEGNSNTIRRKSPIELRYKIPKFPILKGQRLFVDIYEKDGGRHLCLTVSRSAIMKAKRP